MAQLQQTQPSNRLYVAVPARGAVGYNTENYFGYAGPTSEHRQKRHRTINIPIRRSKYLKDLQTSRMHGYPNSFTELPLDGANFEQRAQIARASNLLLPSVQLLNALLVDSEEWKFYKDALPAPAREVIAYPASDQPLEKYIAFEDWNDKGKWHIEVPSDFVGMRNAAIMIAGGFAPGVLPYEIQVEGEERVIYVPDQGNIVAVQDFPQASGNYGLNEQGIPSGLRFPDAFPVRKFPNVHALFRLKGGFIGSLVVCDYGAPTSVLERRNIRADYGPSIPLSMLAENLNPVQNLPMLRELAAKAEDALKQLHDAWAENTLKTTSEECLDVFKKLAPNFDAVKFASTEWSARETMLQPILDLIARAKQ
jgi:hypothetical protein